MRPRDDVATLRWGIHALRLLDTQASVSTADLVTTLGISRAAAYRVLLTLQTAGFVVRAGSPRRAEYRATSRVRALASGYGGDRELVDRARAPLLAFTARHGWPVAVGVPSADGCVVGFTTDHATSRLLTRRPGGRCEPYFSTAIGQACFSALPAPVQQAYRERCRRGELADATPEPGGELHDDGFSRRRFFIDDRVGEREPTLAIPLRHRGAPVGALALRYMRVAANGDAGHQARLDLLEALAADVARELESNERRAAVVSRGRALA